QADDHSNSAYAYIRYADDPNDFVVVVGNFTPVPRKRYRVGVPQTGFYSEILNSDAEIYGGTNVGNGGGVYTEPVRQHDFKQSLTITLPPLAMVIFKPM
ncbi:MAG: alpha amylase C-terminal domain-containing protein, partial [Planctomycetaceae bacterium]